MCEKTVSNSCSAVERTVETELASREPVCNRGDQPVQLRSWVRFTGNIHSIHGLSVAMHLTQGASLCSYSVLDNSYSAS